MRPTKHKCLSSHVISTIPVRKTIPEKDGVYFIAFSNTGKSINAIVSNSKGFIAYDSVNRLQQQNSHLVLGELSSGLNNKLVELPEQYEHSSARYYYAGEHGLYPVTNFMN